MAHANDDGKQSSEEDIANWARLLNHASSGASAAETVASLISREPVADEALLKGICRHEEALRGLTRLLLVGDDEDRQVASNLLFMLSMSEPERPFDASCSAHMANRAIIGSAPGLFPAFVAAIDRGSLPAQNAALNALMSISFDNATNCLLIARTPGMIQVLLNGLNTGTDDSRDGASGVLCNVIYYNKEAARLVLGCDNVLSMLNGLCKSRDMWSKYLGVSVLEACCHQEHAVPMLQHARAVEALREAMASVENETEDAALSQTHTMRLAAMMAIARLVDAKELPSLRMSRETLTDGVEALRFSLQGRAWGCPSIVFLPIDCLNSLANVSRCPENRVDLLKTNVLASYEAMLSKWLDQRNGCEPVSVGSHHSPPDGHLEASSAVLPSATTLQAGFEANGAGMDAEEDAAAEEEAEEEAPAEEVDGEALGSDEAESSEEGDSDSEGEDEEEGEQALAQSTSAVERKTAEPDKVVVSRDVNRVEVELVVATVGTLALSCRRASHTSSSAASQDSERSGGNELSSSDQPEAAFEGLHSKLLPLLQKVGAYACWHALDSVATTHLDWRAWYMEDRSLALLMALHARLGHNSQLRLLDDNSLSLVLKEACCLEVAAACLARHLGV